MTRPTRYLVRSLLACAGLALTSGAARAADPGAAGATAGAASAPARVLASGIDRSSIDPGVRLQDDLFLHVNGTWIRNTSIPPDKAEVGALEQISETTRSQLRGLIEGAAARGGGNAEARKIGDLYAAFMDEAAIETAGIAPLAEELAAIDAVRDGSGLAALFARLDRVGVGMPVGLFIGQDDRESTRYIPTLWQSGLGLPDRDYYLQKDDAKFAQVRAAYRVYLARLLVLGGGAASDVNGAKATADATAPKPAPVDAADATADRITALEAALAAAQRTRVEIRDPVKSYNKFAVGALDALAPALDWQAFLGAAQVAGKSADVLVGQPEYLRAVAALVKDTPLSTWKAYARTHLLAAFAPYLGKAFVDARFAFVGKALAGTSEIVPRWKRGVVLVDTSLGEALGHVYVDTYFPPASKARMETLVANLLAAYRQSIDTLDWMGPETKREAQAKLAKFATKIGYPKRWIDYSSLEIRRDDLVGDVLRARRFRADRDVAKLGKPIDRDEWGMTPQTVNAYYDPAMNEIVFPAAFLQPPSFDPAADDAVNYGAIGAVIGHEISHGFDDSGSQYDGDGNLRDWWTDADRARFKAKTQALVAQYSAFVPVPGYHLNGELTLGENIADNAGLAIALKAYHLSLGGRPAPVLDGLSGDARFFLGWAQAWRAKQRPEALLTQIKTDPHSPEEFRVNGVVRNQPAFYSTFDVKPGDRMYLPPAERVLLW